MRFELEKILFTKYPKIFEQKDNSMDRTCMCWGIECGDGWYELIDDLCGTIQHYIDSVEFYRGGGWVKPKQIKAVQVKEKFGTLRFYTDIRDERVEGMISVAEYRSSTTCERCGSRNNVTQSEGWIVTLCNECHKKRQDN